MIVQCEACQTRFRLADEKVKPGGTKVRCTRCKEVFTVTPLVPEPVEETVDFGSFNMEKIADDAPAEEPPASAPEEQPTPTAPEADNTPEETEPSESIDLDFSTLEAEMGNEAGLDAELADEFSFADTSQPVSDEFAEGDTASSSSDFATEESQAEQFAEEQTDFGATFEEAGEHESPSEFDFTEESGSAVEETESTATDASTVAATESTEFSFDSDDEGLDTPAEVSFGKDEEDNAFSFDDSDDEATPAASEEDGQPKEFSFDDESPAEGDSTSGWDDESTGDDVSFDFDQPQFDIDDSPADSSAPSKKNEELQFGEIDFADENDESTSTSFATDDDFSKATIERKEEPEPFSQSRQSPPPPSSRDYDDEPLLAPPPPKKSSLSRILVLLVLLIIILGGAAGFLYVQEGSLNLHTIARYLPFLQEYIGEDPAASPGDRIGININGTSYVNGQAGQLLVIQGNAVNNHPTARSAITIKGVLVDAKGQALLQQTIFCGNKLDDAALSTLPFTAIEEAMNNQFGDRLSNMNVAAGATIPFTIVFRNLPAGIANINVEVVDSKPGAG